MCYIVQGFLVLKVPVTSQWLGRMLPYPKKTQQNTEWAERTWFNWATQ